MLGIYREARADGTKDASAPQSAAAGFDEGVPGVPVQQTRYSRHLASTAAPDEEKNACQEHVERWEEVLAELRAKSSNIPNT